MLKQTKTSKSVLFRRSLLALALLSQLAVSAASAAPIASANSGSEKLNIVLIMADDMGYETVRVNGGVDYSTPELDRLAGLGMRFTHAFANPVCTPTRVKIMSGLYNARNYTGFGRLRQGERTFAHLLREQGYRTAMAGKWQLGRRPEAPQEFGFEQALLWQHTLPDRTRPDSDHDSRYPNPVFQRNGVLETHSNGAFGPDVLVDFINDFVTTHQEEPFFVYYSMLLPHCPFVPTPDSPEWDPTDLGSMTYKGETRFFPDFISYVDKMVGRVVDHLESLDLMDETIVIFLGDNGTDTSITSTFDGKEVRGGKRRIDDRGTSVPFIAYGPGRIPAGVVTDELVDAADLLPTLADIAGVGAEIAASDSDGVSLWNTLRGLPGREKPVAFVWYNERAKPGEEKVNARTHKRALTRDGLDGELEFWDVATRYQWKRLQGEAIDKNDQAVFEQLHSVIQRFDAVSQKRFSEEQ